MSNHDVYLTASDEGLAISGAGQATARTDTFARFGDSPADNRHVTIVNRTDTTDEFGREMFVCKNVHFSRFYKVARPHGFASAQEVISYVNKFSGSYAERLKSDGGYEFTGAFTARVNEQGQSGANDFGTFVSYTQDMADADQWLRFGFNPTAQAANDVAYWSDPAPLDLDPGFDQTKGLFGGSHMPAGVEKMFDFSFNESPGYSDAVISGDGIKYTAATGSFDFSSCQVGDLALVRFDFQVIPQTANTTIEVGMIWQTRLADGTPTFTFPLTGTPVFYGTGTVGKTFLNRPILSAYFASNEDVNARALLAVRADNPIQVAPLTTLCTIQR